MNDSSPVTINKWLQQAQGQLKQAGIDSYPLDALILLENTTGLNKAHILAHQDKKLSQSELQMLDKLLKRRIKREPIAYIIGKKEFYGREFIVNQSVLIPRPESESFIELLKKHAYPSTHESVVDVGSGSGCLGITIKLEFPQCDVTLVDLDSTTLSVAKNNAIKLGANCKFKSSDLLGSDKKYSTVIANLPYVPKSLSIGPELAYEPSTALFALNKGMRTYRRLWEMM